MKHIILLSSLLFFFSAISFSQCDKKLVLTSFKTEYFDANGVLQRSVDERSVIEVDKPTITIIPENEMQKMSGTITSDTCSWKVAYKEGKTTLVSSFTDGGMTMHGTITIEGKDGMLTLLMKMKEMPNKVIRVSIDSFEEKK